MAGYIGSKAAVVSSGAERKKTFDITTSTTSLTGLSYTVGQVHVFHNGVRLVDGTDYTATNSTSITLTAAAESGDQVVVVSYATFQTSDTVSASAGGTFAGDVTFDGAFTSQGIDDNATSTAMTLDSSGSVGIGTGSPAADYKLDVNGAFTVGGDYNEGTSTNGGGVNIGFNTTTGGNITSLDPAVSWYPISIGASELKFNTFGLEAMRIDSSGNLLVGKTVATSQSTVGISLYPSGGIACTTSNSGTQYPLSFSRGNAFVGTISTSASATSYNTSSDYRLKTDAQPMTGASARVQALNPVNFEWIADGTRVDGFLAHEAQAVVPEAVTGTKDAMRDEEYEVTPAVLDDDGNVVTPAVMGTQSVPDYQGIDQSKLVPLLTAALQEALTKIDAMETRLAALEAV